METQNIESQENEKQEMTPAKMFIRLFIYIIVLGVILFLCAGKTDWVMGWVFLGVHFVVLMFNVFVFPIEQELVEERTQIGEGVKTWDKWLVICLQLFMPFGMLIVAGLDMRYSWSAPLPVWVQITAVVFSGLGYLFSIWASTVNKFYGRFVRIQKDRGHHVIDVGPYSVVRHPGYLGISIFMLTTALALDSLWTLALSGLLTLALIIRTALEDKVLQEELEGYKEYTQKVRYRLLPGIW
jgi:protein-S-isoprenylcysteine O-methyltransferase Ste14